MLELPKISLGENIVTLGEFLKFKKQLKAVVEMYVINGTVLCQIQVEQTPVFSWLMNDLLVQNQRAIAALSAMDKRIDSWLDEYVAKLPIEAMKGGG